MPPNMKKASGIDRDSGRKVKGWLVHQENMFSDPEPCIMNQKGHLFFIKPETLKVEEEEEQ